MSVFLVRKKLRPCMSCLSILMSLKKNTMSSMLELTSHGIRLVHSTKYTA